MKIMVANYLEIQLRINEMCLISVNRRTILLHIIYHVLILYLVMICNSRTMPMNLIKMIK